MYKRQTQVGASTAPGSVVVPVVANAGLTTAGDGIRFSHADPARTEYRRIGALTRLALTQPAYGNYPAGTRVEGVTLGAAGAAVDLDLNADPGATVITVSERTGMTEGGMLAIGLGADLELVEIVSLPAHAPPPDAGNVVLRAPLRIAHLATAGIVVPRAAPTAPVLLSLIHI